MIKRVLLSGGALCATLALTTGMTFATTGSSISGTGKGSTNVIGSATVSLCNTVNKNNTVVNAVTSQNAQTGGATVKDNGFGGSAKTGAATNGSTTGLGVAVTNKNDCPTGSNTNAPLDNASISNTGKNSTNVVASLQFSATNTVNDNNTWVASTTLQNAQTGGATVKDNGFGGSATSGPSTNTSGTIVSINVTNK